MTSLKRYRIKFGKRYKKDLRKLAKANFGIARLEAVVDTLARGEILAPHHRDHALKGDLQGTRECHIGPDWLLLYRKEEEIMMLLLIRTGSHRNVLGLE